MKLIELGLGGFCSTVAALAHKHLSEFDIEDMLRDHGGIQCDVRLRHCRIRFWCYKDDLGSSIKPLPREGGITYASKIVAEEALPRVWLLGMVPQRATPREVERQMLLIVRDYRDVLEGRYGDWLVGDD